MRLCILIPVYNEAIGIAHLVQTLKPESMDIFVVDDGSTDSSGQLAEAAGAIVLRHTPNRGKGYSLRAGFQAVLDRGYDGVIVMDADGQHAVEDLHRFVALAQQYPASIITGDRMGDIRKMPLVRRWTNLTMSWMISCACRQRISDTQCGYRYIGRTVLEKVCLECDGFEVETELLIQAARANIPVYSVPIQVIYRNEVSKINPLRDTVRFFKYFLRTTCFRRQKRV